MSTFRHLHTPESTKTPPHQQDAKRNRILVVEDNQLSSKLLKQLLTAHGYEVSKSPEGLQALDIARDEQPDLILMDIRFPDISGLTRLLKQDDRTKTIPIVAVTALASPDDEKKGLESGCDAYIPKPITLGNFPADNRIFLEDLAREPPDLRHQLAHPVRLIHSKLPSSSAPT